MKVLITGGTSKIGQRLTECLINSDLRLRILARKKESFFINQAEIVKGDLADQISLLKAVEGIDLIIHLAAVTHSHLKKHYWKVNVEGTENLVQAAKQAKAKRFIFISTRAINPCGGAYSQSKLKAEEIIKNSGINWVIVRPAEVYGLGKEGMIDRVIELVKKSYFVPVINNREYPLAPIYIDDLIKALKKLINKGDLTNKIYTLTGPESFSFEDLVDQVCQVYQLVRFKIYLPVFLLKAVFWILKIIPLRLGLAYDQLTRLLSEKSADISLAKKDLDFNPIRFQDGLDLLK